MKKVLYISLFIIFVLSGCKEENKTFTENKDTVNYKSTEQKEEEIKTDSQITKTTPDYVPPKKGGRNKYWYYDRNRKLMNDSTCCFGKGMRHRHRHRWGWGRNNQ